MVVTRADLNYGYQIVQSAHSLADFAVQHPETFKDWHEQSNSLICLAVEDLNQLHKFIDKCKEKNIKYTEFYEPDVNQLTSVCLEPSEQARKITSSLKLAGKSAGAVDKHAPNVERLLQDMSATNQFESQNVLEHGRSVWKYCAEIIQCLQEKNCKDFPIPNVFLENSKLLLSNLYDNNIIRDYCVWHDCGKPYCKTIDVEGKQHFPNHAEVSYETFMKHFPNHPHRDTIARLIRNDMDIHVLKDANVEVFMQKSIQDICTHLVVGLAELFSNAQMFGGYESTSFKIKLKSLTQRTKKICASLKS